MTQGYRVTKNVMYNFASQAVLLVLGIVSSPFIIHTLGNDAYGVLAVATAFIGYLSFLDLGLGASVVKYISEYSVGERKEELEKVIRTSFSVYLLMGLVGAIIIFAFAQTVVTRFMNIPTYLYPTTIGVLYISGIGFIINMILSVISSIPVALQRMDLTSQRNILFGFMNILGTVALLANGQGLQSVVIWNVFTSVIATLAFILVFIRLLPGVSFKPGFDKRTFITLIKFGGFKFFSSISGQIVFQLDRILISFFLPIAAVTFYVAPVTLVQKGLSALSNVTSAVFPALSEAHGLNNLERTKELYLKMTKLTVFLMFPISLILFIFSFQIMQIWLGAEFASRSSGVLRILSLGYFITSLSAPASLIVESSGRPNISAFFAGTSALVNLVSAIIFIPKFGIEGAALALLVNQVLLVPVFVSLVNRKFVKIYAVTFIEQTYFKPIVAGLVSLPFSLYLSGLPTSTLLSLLAGLLTFGSLYLLTNFTFGTFDKNEITAAFNTLRIIKRNFK